MAEGRKISFNKPWYSGKELSHVKSLFENQLPLSGNGKFTKACQAFFREKYGFGQCLLTTSGTDALEMAALLLNIQPGDEVLMPSFTFVSTANAFILRGAKIVFVDSKKESPSMDDEQLERLITPKTRVIVPVHYAGVSGDMDAICSLAEKYSLYVVEDAAQAIDSYYKGKPLGTFGHLAAFSFHETKNISSGEGGMLVINDATLQHRAEIIWEKGTNRTAFWRGEVDKYGWVDVGSSFLPSEITAAVLWAQLECLDLIQEVRKKNWNRYLNLFQQYQQHFYLPAIPDFATHNAHIFHLCVKEHVSRMSFLSYMKEHGVNAVFHYQSLHDSAYFKPLHDGRNLPNSNFYAETLFRMPLHVHLCEEDFLWIEEQLKKYPF